MYRKLIATAGLIAAFAAPSFAQSINLPPDPTNPVSGFGGGMLSELGESFTTPAGGNYLTGFSFWLAQDPDNTGPLSFTANVAAFDGTNIGSPLFTSAVTAGSTNAAFTQYSFNTGFLGLTPGNVYIAFLRAVNGNGGNYFAGTTGANAGGSVAFAYGDAPTLFYTAPGTDVAFAANFANTTPEPSEMALLGMGFVGLVGFVKRRRVLVA